MLSFIVYLMYLPKEKQFFMPYLNGVDMFRNANVTCYTVLYLCYGVCLKKLLLAVIGE